MNTRGGYTRCCTSRRAILHIDRRSRTLVRVLYAALERSCRRLHRQRSRAPCQMTFHFPCACVCLCVSVLSSTRGPLLKRVCYVRGGLGERVSASWCAVYMLRLCDFNVTLLLLCYHAQAHAHSRTHSAHGTWDKVYVYVVVVRRTQLERACAWPRDSAHSAHRLRSDETHETREHACVWCVVRCCQSCSRVPKPRSAQNSSTTSRVAMLLLLRLAVTALFQLQISFDHNTAKMRDDMKCV